MTGLPPNIQISAQRGDLLTPSRGEVRRRDRLLVEWRRAELSLYAATTGEEATPRIAAKKQALNALRQLADALIRAGHP